MSRRAAVLHALKAQPQQDIPSGVSAQTQAGSQGPATSRFGSVPDGRGPRSRSAEAAAAKRPRHEAGACEAAPPRGPTPAVRRAVAIPPPNAVVPGRNALDSRNVLLSLPGAVPAVALPSTPAVGRGPRNASGDAKPTAAPPPHAVLPAAPARPRVAATVRAPRLPQQTSRGAALAATASRQHQRAAVAAAAAASGGDRSASRGTEPKLIDSDDGDDSDTAWARPAGAAGDAWYDAGAGSIDTSRRAVSLLLSDA